MDEAQYLASRVAVIAKGRDRRGGNPGDDRWPRSDADADPVPTAGRGRVRRSNSRDATALPDGSWEVRTDNPTKVVHDLTAWALERGHVYEMLEVTQPSLEDVYLELTGGEEGDE